MNLLIKASMNRLRADFSSTVVTAGRAQINTTGNFSSTVQPSTLSEPNSLDKQMEGKGTSVLSDESKKQIESYRAYKKRKQEEDLKGKKKSNSTPIMPEVLKKSMRRQKSMKQDDISPTV